MEIDGSLGKDGIDGIFGMDGMDGRDGIFGIDGMDGMDGIFGMDADWTGKFIEDTMGIHSLFDFMILLIVFDVSKRNIKSSFSLNHFQKMKTAYKEESPYFKNLQDFVTPQSRNHLVDLCKDWAREQLEVKTFNSQHNYGLITNLRFEISIFKFRFKSLSKLLF